MVEKPKQKTVEGNDLPKVDESEEERTIVSYQTEHFLVRTTPKSVEKAQSLDLEQREAWLKSRMRVTEPTATGCTPPL